MQEKKKKMGKPWNPLRGCSRVDAGCENCCAEAHAAAPNTLGYEGLIRDYVEDRGVLSRRWNGTVRTIQKALYDPFRRTGGVTDVCTASDAFHDNVTRDYRVRMWAVMMLSPTTTFLVTTRRTGAAVEFLNSEATADAVHETAHEIALSEFGRKQRLSFPKKTWPLPNVWIGASCSNQAELHNRMGDMIRLRTDLKFLAYEPAIAPLNLYVAPGIFKWVVAGGELGGSLSRPTDPEWIRSVRDCCKISHIPFSFHGWGSWLPFEVKDGKRVYHAPPEQAAQIPDGLPARMFDATRGSVRLPAGVESGRTLDGKTHNALPQETPRAKPTKTPSPTIDRCAAVPSAAQRTVPPGGDRASV